MDNDKKQHKIALMLNQATNKMSNTGTAFSLGNWETDTIAYMEWIDELSLGRILDIVGQSQPFVKHIHCRGQDDSADGDTQAPMNPRSHIRICNVFLSLSTFLNLTPISYYRTHMSTSLPSVSSICTAATHTIMHFSMFFGPAALISSAPFCPLTRPPPYFPLAYFFCISLHVSNNSAFLTQPPWESWPPYSKEVLRRFLRRWTFLFSLF